jgi:iron complex outermembrane receptor protein
VITIRTGYANAGSKRFEGITAQLNYDFELPTFGREAGSLGRMAVALNWFDLRRLETRVGLGDLDREAGEIGDSKHQGVLRLNYLNRGFSWQIQSQYIGSAAWDVDEEPDTRDFPRVRNLWLFDTTLGYEVSDNFTVRAIVDNVFDRRAPFPVPAGGGVITYYDAIFGRNYTLSMSYRF